MNKKILTNNFEKKISELKKKKKSIVMCHGVFDLIHIGHIEYFKEAKRYGDILIVSVTSDKFVKKGINRPTFNIADRLIALSSLNYVDYVVESNNDSAVKNISIIKPNYYVKGNDYKNLSKDLSKKIILEKRTVEKFGGKLVFTESELNSSSKLLFSNNLIFSEGIKNYFLRLKKKFSFNELEKTIKKIQKLKILIIGDTIIDKYVFCETVGKASKDPMLVIKEKETKKFIGGAASIAQNCLELSKNVTLMTKIGKKNSNYKFFKKRINGCKLNIINCDNKFSNEKLRYVDEASNSKILGVYDVGLSSSDKFDNFQIESLKKEIKKYDVVIVYDYFHGCLNTKLSRLIINNNKNHFVNCQMNSSNRGISNIKSYKNSNCLIINLAELRFEMRDGNSAPEFLIKKFAKNYSIEKVVVTLGSDGVLMYFKKTNKIIKTPGFANRVTDKVGAGDIIQLVLSLFFSTNKNYELGLIAASMFAAKSVENYGNENIINTQELMKFFSTFLK